MGIKNGVDNPEHLVNLSAFWVYRSKVTNNQYALCVSSGRCTLPAASKNENYNDPLRGNDPVVGVNYEQASAYCSFANARLPTEAEWEKTARGPGGNIYPWGSDNPNCNLLNYSTCIGSTTSVVQYPQGQSYYHALDMEGNALEWVADWYQQDYYRNTPIDNPPGPDKGSLRVVRSSAFNSGGNQTQSYHRFQSSPETQRENLGFRCVVEPDQLEYFAPFCEYPATYGTDGIGGEPISEPPAEMECPNIDIIQIAFCQGSLPITNVKFELTFYKDPYSLTYFAPNYCGKTGYGSPPDYECRGNRVTGSNNKLSFCSYCNVTTKSPPQCPAGYEFNQGTKTCVLPTLPPKVNPATITCLPGFSPSNSGNNILTTAVPLTPSSTSEIPAGQCCAYTPQTYDESKLGDLRNPICKPNPNGIGLNCFPPFPSCPIGTFFDGQSCLTIAHPKFCLIEPVDFKSCIDNGDDLDPNVKQEPAGCNITEQSCGNSCLPYGYIYNPDACTCDCLTG